MTTTNDTKSGQKPQSPSRSSTKRSINPANLDLEERVVTINRVSKVVKGGRRFSFSTIVVVGDQKGHVGIGMGKAGEVPLAIQKGVEDAKKNIIRVPISHTTIPHDIETKFAKSRVRLFPASPGTGVIAGGSVRPVLEAAGIKDVFSKSYGSNNPINVVKATFQALSELTTVEEQARMRGISIAELRRRRLQSYRKSSPQSEAIASETYHAIPNGEVLPSYETSQQLPSHKPPSNAKTGVPPSEEYETYQQLLAIARQNGDIAREIYALTYLADIAQRENNITLAREHYNEALRRSQVMPDNQLRGIILGQLSLLEHAEANHLQALASTLRALSIFERHNMPERQIAVNNLTTLRATMEPAHFAAAWSEAVSALSKTDRALIKFEELEVEIGPARRTTEVIFPERCQINQIATLHIQLRLAPAEFTREVGGPNTASTAPATNLTVRVSSAAFIVDTPSRSLLLPFDSDSETIHFNLTARHIGVQSIDVQFFHNTARVGYVVIETEIVEDLTSGFDKNYVLLPVDDPNGEIKGETARQPDIRIQTHLTADKYLEFSFRTKSIDSDIEAGKKEYNDAQVRISTTWTNLSAHLNDLITITDPDPSQLQDIWKRLEGLGKELKENLLPADLQVDSKTWSSGSVIFINTKEHWIPWELIYDDDFWGRKFIIARFPTLTATQARHISEINGKQKLSAYLSKIVNIIGTSMPPADIVLAESLFADLSYSTHPIVLKGSDVSLTKLIDEVRQSDIVHFTCHGRHDTPTKMYALLIDAAKDASPLKLLYPSDINSFNELRGSIIFANACSSGKVISPNTEFHNFGVHFYTEAVAAYIGALNELPSREATNFAKLFYEQIWLNKTVGDALAETKALTAVHDPFPLLYTLYGDPFARKIRIAFDNLPPNELEIP